MPQCVAVATWRVETIDARYIASVDAQPDGRAGICGRLGAACVGAGGHAARTRPGQTLPAAPLPPPARTPDTTPPPRRPPRRPPSLCHRPHARHPPPPRRPRQPRRPGRRCGRDRRRCEVGGLAVGRRAASGRKGAGGAVRDAGCRAALPRRVRPPVFVFVAARWWGQAAWSGQAARPVGRRSSDERPERARVVMTPFCRFASRNFSKN